MTDQVKASSNDERKIALRVALEEVVRTSSSGGAAPYDGSYSWPLLLIESALSSESAGDADAQDKLIEAFAVLLGLGTDEPLTIPQAANRLSGERSRGFIISTLHGFQISAEAKVKELKAEREADPDPDGRTDLVGQSRHHQGVVEALGYAIELVNLSALPGDNDQQVGELITVNDAKVLTEAFEAVPDQAMNILDMTGHELPALLARLKKLAGTPDARQEELIEECMCGHAPDEHEGGDGECVVEGCGCAAFEQVEADDE